MTRPAHEIALRAWVRRVLAPWDTVSPAHAVDVIYADQEGPALIPPYAVVRFPSDRPLGRPETRETWDEETETLTQETLERREGTLSITIRGGDHSAMADALGLAQEDDDARTEINAAGIGLGPELLRRNLGKFSDNVTENRTLFEIAYRRCAVSTRTVGHIEHPAVQYTPQNADGTGVEIDLILPPEEE